MKTTEARKAYNEAIFRGANEEIRQAREELALASGKTPFVCECSYEQCRDLVLLDLEAYEAIRADATRFFVVEGHASQGRVAERRDGYCVVEKSGIAGEIARETYPRERMD